MSEKEISTFLEPHLQILRAISHGAGNHEILAAKRSIGSIVVKFNYAPVHEYARRSINLLDKAFGYVDLQKKNAAATEGAAYFADRIFITICECEKNKLA